MIGSLRTVFDGEASVTFATGKRVHKLYNVLNFSLRLLSKELVWNLLFLNVFSGSLVSHTISEEFHLFSFAFFSLKFMI